MIFFLAAWCIVWSALSGAQLQLPGAYELRGGLAEAKAGGARGETFHLVKFLPWYVFQPPSPQGREGDSALRQ